MATVSRDAMYRPTQAQSRFALRQPTVECCIALCVFRGTAAHVGSTIPWSDFAGDDEGGVVEAADEEEAAEMERRRRNRDDTRFDSISEEIKALNSGLISEPSTVAEVDTRQPCPQCGRKFLPDRLQRHVKVCEDLKRGKEWRGTWKSPSAGGGSKNNLLLESRSGTNTSLKL